MIKGDKDKVKALFEVDMQIIIVLPSVQKTIKISVCIATPEIIMKIAIGRNIQGGHLYGGTKTVLTFSNLIINTADKKTA